MLVKTPFGIYHTEKKKFEKLFDSNAKKAAKLFLEEEKYQANSFDEDLRDIFPFKDKEFSSWLTQFGISLTKLRLKNKDREEAFFIQTVRGYQEMVEQINKVEERLEELKSTGFKDKVVLEKYSEQLKTLKKFRDDMEKYIKEKAKQLMPNASDILGPILAAEFLAKAGSLKKLSRLPASTLQVLGAEKALFRYLKGKGKSPKYGLIAKSPFVINAPKEKTGKVARLLALKLSVAFRADYFSREYNPKIKEEFLKKLKEIA